MKVTNFDKPTIKAIRMAMNNALALSLIHI